VDGSSKELSNVNRAADMSIDLCCTWDKQISDGILKFKLVNMQEKQRNEVREAFDSWNKHLTTLRLVQTAGQSVNNLDQSGYITNAKIILSDKIFDRESISDTLYNVVLHEIGHVLGLGHANFDDLMNPLVNNMDEISVCDVKGVFKTNELVLKNNASSSLQARFSENNIVSC
jgi:hypothetical protein